MKDYVKENERILEEWKEARGYKAEKFAPDGIMYMGEIWNGERYPSETDNEKWANTRPRILFITKDQNVGGDEYSAWDVRVEMADFKYAFYRNLCYQLYGLLNTTPGKKADYTFTNDEALKLYAERPMARINVKKEAGSSSLSNSTLKRYLEDDREFIIKQINNLDADIMLCCGYTEKDGNLILDFLNNNGYNFVNSSKGDWIYFDVDKNKIAINNWHLSARIKSESTYNEMMDAYYEFMVNHPDFFKNLK